ncbi:MAG: winged helix-turn-helix domain-containing protein [Pseudomonadota bacterium]
MSGAYIFKFDNYVLDTASRELSFRQQEIRVEPKVFDFISLLLASHDQVLSKAQIATALWPGGEVSDAMLSRCVYQARKALQQSKESPEYIKTQYGRGFRFSGTFSVHSKGVNGIRSIAKNTVNEIFPVVPGKAETKSVHFDAIVNLGLCFGCTDEIRTKWRDWRELATAITSRLECVPGIVLNGDSQVNKSNGAGQSDSNSNDIGHDSVLNTAFVPDRNGDPAFFRADLKMLSDNQRVTLGFYDLKPLMRNSHPDDRAKYLNTVSDEIASRLSLCLGKGNLSPGDSGDPDAYRLYREANWKLAEHTEREGNVAQALLEEAVKIDPGFAGAWTELGWAYYENMWAGGNGRFWVDLAMRSVDNAIQLEPNCSFARMTQIIFMTELGKSSEALKLATESIGRDPEQAEYWYAHSYVLRYLGRIEESNQSLQKSHSLYPLIFAEVGDPPTGLIYTGEWKQFLQLVPAHDSPYFCYYRGYAMWQLGKKDEAIVELNQGIQDDPKDNFSRLSRALVLIIEKDLVGANDVLEKLVRQRVMLMPGDSEFTYKEAQLLMLCGNETLALQRLQASYDNGFNVLPYCECDPAFAPVLQTAEFQQMALKTIH